MTPDVLVGAAAAAVSVVIMLVPQLKAKYEAKPAEEKVQIIALASAGIVALVVVGSCVPQLVDLLPKDWVIECTSKGIGDVTRLLLVAFGSNQGFYKFVLKPIEAALTAQKPA